MTSTPDPGDRYDEMIAALTARARRLAARLDGLTARLEGVPLAWVIIGFVVVIGVLANIAGLPTDMDSEDSARPPTTTAPPPTTSTAPPATTTTTAPPPTTTTAPPPTTTTAPPPTTTAAPPPPTTAKPAPLFPGRVDAHREDQERPIGAPAMLSGYTATVLSVSGAAYDAAGFVTAEVTILNRDEKTQSYSPYDWRLQTPAGRVVDASFLSTLDSVDLVHGGTATGTVTFRSGDEVGDFYLIYKPDSFDAARGIWKVTVLPETGVQQ